MCRFAEAMTLYIDCIDSVAVKCRTEFAVFDTDTGRVDHMATSQ